MSDNNKDEVAKPLTFTEFKNVVKHYSKPPLTDEQILEEWNWFTDNGIIPVYPEDLEL